MQKQSSAFANHHWGRNHWLQGRLPVGRASSARRAKKAGTSCSSGSGPGSASDFRNASIGKATGSLSVTLDVSSNAPASPASSGGGASSAQGIRPNGIPPATASRSADSPWGQEARSVGASRSAKAEG